MRRGTCVQLSTCGGASSYLGGPSALGSNPGPFTGAMPQAGIKRAFGPEIGTADSHRFPSFPKVSHDFPSLLKKNIFYQQRTLMDEMHEKPNESDKIQVNPTKSSFTTKAAVNNRGRAGGGSGWMRPFSSSPKIYPESLKDSAFSSVLLSEGLCSSSSAHPPPAVETIMPYQTALRPFEGRRSLTAGQLLFHGSVQQP